MKLSPPSSHNRPAPLSEGQKTCDWRRPFTILGEKTLRHWKPQKCGPRNTTLFPLRTLDGEGFGVVFSARVRRIKWINIINYHHSSSKLNDYRDFPEIQGPNKGWSIRAGGVHVGIELSLPGSDWKPDPNTNGSNRWDGKVIKGRSPKFNCFTSHFHENPSCTPWEMTEGESIAGYAISCQTPIENCEIFMHREPNLTANKRIQNGPVILWAKRMKQVASTHKERQKNKSPTLTKIKRSCLHMPE